MSLDNKNKRDKEDDPFYSRIIIHNSECKDSYA